MRTTGIVRKLDPLGRIVLPIELRKTMDIEDRGTLEIFTDGDYILLRKYLPGCIICGEARDLMQINNKPVCRKCATLLAAKLEEGDDGK